MSDTEMLKLEKAAQEGLAIRVLGQEAYDNSPCQAHPLELVEMHIGEQDKRIAELEAELTDEQVLLLVCDNTGKRVSLPNFALDELKVFASAVRTARVVS